MGDTQVPGFLTKFTSWAVVRVISLKITIRVNTPWNSFLELFHYSNAHYQETHLWPISIYSRYKIHQLLKQAVKTIRWCYQRYVILQCQILLIAVHNTVSCLNVTVSFLVIVTIHVYCINRDLRRTTKQFLETCEHSLI